MKKVFRICIFLLFAVLFANKEQAVSAAAPSGLWRNRSSCTSQETVRSVLDAPQKNNDFSRTYSKQVTENSNNTETSYVWHKDGVMPFDELIVSWNAIRPCTGKYTIFTRVKGKKWSGWLKYAEWGAMRQQSFSYSKDDVAQLNMVTVALKGGVLATEFEVKVEACGGAHLANLHKLYACLSNINKYVEAKVSPGLMSGFVDMVPQQSQKLLKHQRAKDMCSPTATSTVLSYFLEKLEKNEGGWVSSNSSILRTVIDPVDFAALVHDDGHDIYGNWVLNMAQAYDISGGKVPCCVERLASFDELYTYLRCDRPVVVSVQGPLKGSASPYQHGHLMVVIGWDALAKRVLCIDSAFGSNNTTKVWYDIDAFCKAWGRRKNLSYVFMPMD